MTEPLSPVEIGGPCCACLPVVYAPQHHDGGTVSDRWECRDCGTEFGRVARLRAELEETRTKIGLRELARKQHDANADLAIAYDTCMNERDALRAENAKLRERAEKLEAVYIVACKQHNARVMREVRYIDSDNCAEINAALAACEEDSK